MTLLEEGQSLKCTPVRSIYYFVNKYFIVGLKSCFNDHKLETRVEKVFCIPFFHVSSWCLLSVFD